MKKFTIIVKGFLAILCIAPFKLSAQSESNIRHFNTANGLSQNTITGMAFDKIGYLWLGTQNGLMRYDGTSFKTYLSDPINTSNNGSTTVLNISFTSSGNKILIRMRDGLVYTTENGKPLLYSNAVKTTSYHYELEGRFPSLSIFDKFNLPVSELTGIHKWSPGTKAVLPVNKTDFIVLSENDKVLFYYGNGTKQKEIQLESHFTKFLKSGEHNLMLDDKFNLYLYDSLSSTFNKIPIEWKGVKKENWKLNERSFLWDKLNDQSYFFYNSIFYLLRFDTAGHAMKFIPRFSIKDEGLFWTNIVYDSTSSTYFLSTFTEGLFQAKLKQIQTITLNEKTINSTTAGNAIGYALLRTSDSTVLTTTGIELSSTATDRSTIKKKGNIFSNRETIANIADTAILCVQQNQLVYYSRSDGFQRSRIFNDFFNKNYRSFITLLQPEGDSVWVCSDIGIFSLKQNNVTVLYYRKPDEQSLHSGARLFYRISEDEVLFSNNLGLYKLRTSPPYTIDSFPEMKDKQVRGIVKYNGVFLLSVYKHGLFVLKDSVFHKVPVSEDQPEPGFCHSLFLDKNENIWITADKGLFRSSIASIVESALKPGIHPFFFKYNESDGIVNGGFTGSGMPPYALLRNGQIFYPTASGVVTFNPGDLNNRLLKSAIQVEKILLDDQEPDALVNDSIYLPPDFKVLGIDLAVPHLGNPENLVLEYNIDNKGWKKIPVAISQRIMLYDISPGYHQIFLRKRIGFESTDYVYKKLIIYKRKHIYQQLWFYPVLIIAFILLVLLIIKLRKENINRQRRQLQIRVDDQVSELSKTVEAKELLISIMSHDMITPLNHVRSIAGALAKYPEQDPGKMTDALSAIKATSDKILAGSQGIINYMKYNSSRVVVNKQRINLYDEVNEVLDTFFSIARRRNITLVNKVSKYIFVEIDDNIFGIILSNIISNAIHYSGCDNVQVFLEAASGLKPEIILKVEDNGSGINNDRLGEIRELIKGNLQVIKAGNESGSDLSYIIISELVRIHTLSVSVESKLNKGTVVSIVIPDGPPVADAGIFYDVN